MRQTSRALFTVVLLLSAAAVLVYYRNWSDAVYNTASTSFRDHHVDADIHEYWTQAMSALAALAPEVSAKDIQGRQHGQSITDTMTKANLLQRIDISDETIAELKAKHSLYMGTMPHALPYTPETNGIVFIGGGRFTWLAYVSIMGLRDTGSKLPIELVMPTWAAYEEELYLCKRVLPRLNARCVVIPAILGEEAMLRAKERYKSYQFKSLALVVSLFQNVLLLDSDNVPLDNPDFLFTSKVYQEHGLVTWPDFWQRTTHPLFYDIAGTKVNELKRIRIDSFPIPPIQLSAGMSKASSFHEFEGTMVNPLTESGQLLVNKKTHSKTLLLLLYYNVYGLRAYYKLLTTGEAGEGDKDTFLAAALVVKDPYYQVVTNVRSLGFFHNSGFRGVAMMQRNPELDYEQFQLQIPQLNNPQLSATQLEKAVESLDDEHFTANNDLPYLFMHCNFPKLEPDSLIKSDIFDHQTMRLGWRMYSEYRYQNGPLKGGDFELQMWKNMQRALCYEKIPFTNFEDKDTGYICSVIANEVSWLIENPPK